MNINVRGRWFLEWWDQGYREEQARELRDCETFDQAKNSAQSAWSETQETARNVFDPELKFVVDKAEWIQDEQTKETKP